MNLKKMIDYLINVIWVLSIILAICGGIMGRYDIGALAMTGIIYCRLHSIEKKVEKREN